MKYLTSLFCLTVLSCALFEAATACASSCYDIYNVNGIACTSPGTPFDPAQDCPTPAAYEA